MLTILADWVLVVPRWLRRFYGRLVPLTAIVMFLIATVPVTVQAQNPYPPFLDPHLNDYGKLLSQEDATNIRRTLSQFQAETSVQIVVMTISSVADYRTGDRTIESFATNLFNTWKIGDRTRNDGILLLVAPGDRKVRIELGSGYPDSHNQIAQTIIDRTMLPYFRENQISQGIVSGVDAMTQQFNPTSVPNSSPAPLLGTETSTSPTVKGAGLFMGSIAAFLTGTFVMFQHWRRHRQRHCPKCKAKMERLEENQEDQYLQTGQQTEELLKSMDYDVWHCPSCGYHQTLRYENRGSSFKRCSRCGHKTLEIHSSTTRSATSHHEGEEKITERCQHCQHHNTRYRSIPRLETSESSSATSSFSSSSDSSSSDSGGSSDGGGASGDW